MPDDPAPPPAPTPPPPPPAPRRPGQADWRRDPAVAEAGSNRGAKRAFAFIALLAAVGGILGVIKWIMPPTPPHLISVPGSEFTNLAWPANPWAVQDSDLLCSLADVFKTREKGFNFQEFDRLADRLKKLKDELKADQAVVLHMSGMARTHNGAVYLIPGQANPDNPATWLPLKSVLDAFKDCPAKDKLLLLDVVRSMADPFRGPLMDDVAEKLDAELREAKPPFLVLCSCGPGEVALPLDDQQSSAFMEAVVQGLSSVEGRKDARADRYNPKGESDDKASARELAAFVRARVARWAQQVRGARQTPTLYGPDGYDFPLTFKRQEMPEVPAPVGYPAELTKEWQRRDAARADGAPRRAPAAFADLDARLLRVERGWRAGRTPNIEVEALQTPLGAGRAATAVPLRSLGAAAGLNPRPPELETSFSTYAGFLFAVPAPPPDAPKSEDMVKALKVFLATSAKDRGVTAGKLIWERLLSEQEPSQQRLQALTKMLVTQVEPPASEEGLLLQRLSEWKSTAMRWPAAAVHIMMEADNAAGQALALLPAGFPWVKEAIEAADVAKREGERKFFDAENDIQVRAAVDRFVVARDGFTAVRNRLQAVQSARRTLAEAAVVLTGTAPGVIAGDVDETVWGKAARDAADVADMLTRPADDRAPVPTEDQIFALQASLRTLEAPYVPATVQQRVKAAGPAEEQALRYLVRGPLLTAPLRPEVWGAVMKVTGQRHADVQKLNAEDDETRHNTSAPPNAAPDVGAQAELGGRRARVSVALLRLAGVEGADRLDAARRTALIGSAEWQTLVAGLHDAWVKQRPDEYQKRLKASAWPAADRLGFGPALQGAGALERVDVPPAERLRSQEDGACRAWLEGHYTAYGQQRATWPGAPRALYEDAAAASRRR